MRLFTAIELSDDAREAIMAEQKRVVGSLKRPAGALRLVHPEQLHLTLVFIGEATEERAAGIVRVMSADIPQAPYRIVFGGIGAFPERGAPRVLYLALTVGEEATVDVHRQVCGRLESAGVPPESRPFHPHLTLGRWRDSRPADRPPRSVVTNVAQIDVSAVALFQSRLSSSGPTYTRLIAARLVCP